MRDEKYAVLEIGGEARGLRRDLIAEPGDEPRWPSGCAGERPWAQMIPIRL